MTNDQSYGFKHYLCIHRVHSSAGRKSGQLVWVPCSGSLETKIKVLTSLGKNVLPISPSCQILALAVPMYLRLSAKGGSQLLEATFWSQNAAPSSQSQHQLQTLLMSPTSATSWRLCFESMHVDRLTQLGGPDLCLLSTAGPADIASVICLY